MMIKTGARNVMKKIRNRIWALAVALFTAVSGMTVVGEQVKADQVWPEGPSIGSPSAIVMEANTGTILYEKNSHAELYPASITKIMTTLLAIENCSMDEIVTFSADAVFKNEGDTSHIARDLGEQLTVEQCLYAVMLESANECAYAVAEHVGANLGGDYQTFIDLMNEKAKELGCTNTHFNNANGLPDEQHWTSAYDMALISQAAYQNETFRTITGTKSYTLPVTNKCDEEYPLHNHHKMLYPYRSSKYLYDYCVGGKTGYTDVAKNTLVTYVEKDGITLVIVVMNAATTVHYTDTITLADYYLNNFQALSIAENEQNINTEGIENAGLLNTNPSFVTLDDNAYIILPKTAPFTDAEFSLKQKEEGENVASLEYTYGGKIVGSVDIVTSKATVSQVLVESPEVEKKSDENVVIIKPYYFLILLFVIFILMVVILIGKKFYDNFYVIRHNMEVKRYEKNRFQSINRKRKRRRRKKDRLFR